MKILFIADGRSPIALNWMRYWTQQPDNEITLLSTFPASADLPLTRLEFLPVAFSQAKSPSSASTRQTHPSIWGAASLPLRLAARHWLGPLTLPKAAARLNEIIRETQPDLIHAMRIPYEGMLAAVAKKRYDGKFPPLLVSIWGNDFTLHAPSSPLMRYHTRQTLKMADALHADCERDIRLAADWGFDMQHPNIVLPGSGGVDSEIFYPPAEPREEPPLIINPRGIRSYVRNDTFFKAIPLVLAERPDIRFICPAMQGVEQAEDWVRALGIEKSVQLTSPLEQNQLADRFRRAALLISPSVHDGTPNSLIEGMACGCFPIAGDLESIREWITDGENGLLVNPADENALAAAILRALNNKSLREQALVKNQKLIASRAEYKASMEKAESFYQRCTAVAF